jgi:hypothetical protein
MKNEKQNVVTMCGERRRRRWKRYVELLTTNEKYNSINAVDDL